MLVILKVPDAIPSAERHVGSAHHVSDKEGLVVPAIGNCEGSVKGVLCAHDDPDDHC